MNQKRSRASHFRRLRMEPLEHRNLLAVLTVNSGADNKLAGDGLVTLREAIIAANANAATDLGEIGSGADTIVFHPSVTGTIALTFGEMLITESLTVTGPGRDVLTIDAQNASRIFNITAASGSYTISGLTITGGVGGGILSSPSISIADSRVSGNAGHGIRSEGNITVTNSIVSNNAGIGASTYYGQATVVDSTFDGNGPYSVRAGGNITVTRSTISNGGGIRGGGHATVTDSSITGNTAGTNGGGIYLPTFPFPGVGILTLTNSVVSGNVASGISGGNPYIEGGHGGGIHAKIVNATNSTINDNRALGDGPFGGGIYAITINLTDCVVSGNSAYAGHGNIEGHLVALGGGVAGTTVTLTRTEVIGNTALGRTARGGGVAATTATIIDSTISGNLAAGDPRPMGSYSGGPGEGGGLRAHTMATVTGSTISGNHVTGRTADGGGIWAGNGTLTSSLVSGNSAAGVQEFLEQEGGSGRGGGLFGIRTITNSTISGNHSNGRGGGSWGGLNISHSTFTKNHAVRIGGGIFGPGNLVATIVAGNTAGESDPDLTGADSVRFSIIGDNAGTTLVEAQTWNANGSLIGSSAGGGVIDPRLAALADSGGPTRTHALLPDSPALDAIPYVKIVATHDYQLNGSLIDSQGGPSLTSLGGTLTAAQYQFAANQGLFLTNAGIDAAEYSIEMRFHFNSLPPGWQKIIDFHGLALDTGLYSQSDGLEFLNRALAADVLTTGSMQHLVLTRDDLTDVVRAYINGVEVWNFVDAAGEAVFDVPNRMMRFFQDDNATGQVEAGGGVVDMIRVYNRPLTPTEVVALVDPIQNIPAIDQRGAPYARIVDADGLNGAQIDIGAFESQGVPTFSKYDYNENGVVDAADYTVWRNLLGETDLEPYTGADGDGDGSITQLDFNLWKSHYNEGMTATPPGMASGAAFEDFNVPSLQAEGRNIDGGDPIQKMTSSFAPTFVMNVTPPQSRPVLQRVVLSEPSRDEALLLLYSPAQPDGLNVEKSASAWALIDDGNPKESESNEPGPDPLAIAFESDFD